MKMDLQIGNGCGEGLTKHLRGKAKSKDIHVLQNFKHTLTGKIFLFKKKKRLLGLGPWVQNIWSDEYCYNAIL